MEKPKMNDREHQIMFEPPVDSRTASAAIGIHYKTLERLARKRPGSGDKAWTFLAIQALDPQRLVQRAAGVELRNKFTGK